MRVEAIRESAPPPIKEIVIHLSVEEADAMHEILRSYFVKMFSRYSHSKERELAEHLDREISASQFRV